jgi:hypothetical protein
MTAFTYADPFEHPRIYKTSLGWKIFLLTASATFFGAGLFGMWFFYSGVSRSPGAVLFLELICLGVAA